jgi:transposase
MTIVAAPEEQDDHVRHLTRTQLIRIVAAGRPDVSNAADPAPVRHVAFKSLVRR